MPDEPKQADELLAAMRAVCDAATEGPLQVEEVHTEGRRTTSWQMSYDNDDGGDLCPVGEADTKEDAEFFTQARTDWPRAIAAAECAIASLNAMYDELQGDLRSRGGGAGPDPHHYHPTQKHDWCVGCHLEKLARILAGEGG